MLISEFSRMVGVPIATIKYYLQEGLLPRGEATSTTRAHYGQHHVARIRLVRALLSVGRLSITEAKAVVDALGDGPSESSPDPAGSGALLSPGITCVDDAPGNELIDEQGWWDLPSDARSALNLALRAAADAGVPVSPDKLRSYARACRALAAADVEDLEHEADAAKRAYAVVVGSIMMDPVVSSLHRLALEHERANRGDRVAVDTGIRHE